MSKPDLIPSAEATERLGVNRRTLTRWVGSGLISPALKMPGVTGAYLFDAAEIERVASERKTA